MNFIFLWLLSAQSGSAAEPGFDSYCGLNRQAAALSAAIINHPQQQRATLNCHPVLAVAAAVKARQMAKHQQISHDLDNLTPNQLLRQFGYALPVKYQAMGNQIESIAGGHVSVESVLDAFMRSNGHRSHLMAEHDFYKHQKHIAVGYYFDPMTPHEYHWVVYIAAPRNTDVLVSDDLIIADIKKRSPIKE